jgi:hypothetical protein
MPLLGSMEFIPSPGSTTLTMATGLTMTGLLFGSARKAQKSDAAVNLHFVRFFTTFSPWRFDRQLAATRNSASIISTNEAESRTTGQQLKRRSEWIPAPAPQAPGFFVS